LPARARRIRVGRFHADCRRLYAETPRSKLQLNSGWAGDFLADPSYFDVEYSYIGAIDTLFSGVNDLQTLSCYLLSTFVKIVH